MEQEKFAHNNGFESYTVMVTASIVIFRNDGCEWLVTPTKLGYLAWIDKFLDKPLGYFDTIREARDEIWDSHPS
ncbi:MAG: hypothetical protein P4L69_14165 [Desulfosporosinus sp.]|nr:hypothetical protein [Desulfosporosinus sp.]